MLTARSEQRYVSVKSDDAPLRKRLREPAQARPRRGMRRLYSLLRREGWLVNHKRVEQLDREEGLQMRVKRRRKLVSMARGPRAAALKRDDLWAIDFVQDSLVGGRRITILVVVDVFSRECVGLDIAFDMKGTRATDTLNRFIEHRGAKPRALKLDNGTEFRSHHFDEWAYQRKVQMEFTRPGKPVENAFIESFNGSLRDECLNVHWLEHPEHARHLNEAWRVDSNEVRPHSSFCQLPPAAYRPPAAAPGPLRAT